MVSCSTYSSSSPSSMLCTVTILFLLCVSNCNASFSWSNCGTQLHPGINYVKVAISPDTILTNRSLSINVKANIVSTIYNADTRLTVWKDDELFLSTNIQDLCSIVRASTNSLSCPIPEGDLSFTYTFNNAPTVVQGEYKVKIESLSFGKELGCLAITGTVDGLKDATQCSYTSKFSVSIHGDYTTSNNLTHIQVGPVDRTNVTGQWGKFVTPFVGTNDVGGTISTTNYVWGINATIIPSLTESNEDASHTTRTYAGDMFVGNRVMVGTVERIEPLFFGKTNWTIIYTKDGSPEDLITGFFWFDPLYSAPSAYQYPVVLGNLGPFTMTRKNDAYFEISGEREWCTCGRDSCGVCGGDGSSCLVSHTTQSEWSIYRKTALGVGLAGGFLGLIAVVALFYVLLRTKARNQRRHDDQDLIDTPEKPDYGTLAIDEVIREGDRA